jgi:hypothetical protein
MEVLVGTESGLVEAGNGRGVTFEGRDVVAMSGPWLVLDGQRLHLRSGHAGSETGVPGHRVNCVASRPDGGAWAGTAEAHLFVVGTGEVPQRVESFEAAEGRDAWYTPWGGPPDVRSICTLGSGTVLVNVHVGGILRSEDEGASWEPTIDLHLDVHQVVAVERRGAVAACAHGLATSLDDGRTWSVSDQGLPATYARAVAVTGGTVILGVSRGPGGGAAAIYRRPLEDEAAFERCRSGLPESLDGNIDTSWLAGSPDGRAAFATRSGDLYSSEDEGRTWELLASGLPPVRCLSLS